jgi:hypothetical protein
MVIEGTSMMPLTRNHRRAREKDLQGHFTQEDAQDLEPQDVQEESEEVGQEEAANRPDPQLVRSLEVLKSWIYFDRFHVDPVLDEVKDKAEGEVETADEPVDDERG